MWYLEVLLKLSVRGRGLTKGATLSLKCEMLEEVRGGGRSGMKGEEGGREKKNPKSDIQH